MQTRWCKGFTSIELVLALVVLSLGCLPLIGMIAGTGREAGFSEEYLLAHARLEAVLDAQEQLGFKQLAEIGAEERELPIPEAAGPTPAMPGLHERLTGKRIAERLIVIKMEVGWTFMTDRSGAPAPHRARSMRVIAQPDSSWLVDIPLSPGGGNLAD